MPIEGDSVFGVHFLYEDIEPKWLRKLRNRLIMFYVWFTVYVGFAGVAVLFIIRPPTNFSPSSIGYWSAELNATKFIGATIVNYLFLHKLKWTDIRVLIIYTVSLMGLSISTAFSDTTWKVFVGKNLIFVVFEKKVFSHDSIL